MFKSVPQEVTQPSALVAQWRADGARLQPGDEGVLTDVIDAVGQSDGDPWHMALEAADVLAYLKLDADSLLAALFLGVGSDAQTVERLIDGRKNDVWSLVEGARRMRDLHALLPEESAKRRSPDQAAQVERLRKMVLAMAQDGRVVVLHLAFHLVNLRRLVRDGDAKQRADAAHETFELLAPLANRLGIWQVKWEMEDLAFRARDPDGYKKIASQLDEKRADRERFIADVTALLRRELAGAGLRADVSGRPKHIYSIWKKMQRKDLGFQDLFDVRGVRILVDDVKDCYAALGLVHHLWVPIPREFDDYIARPKANNYRSLHTAVIGPEEKVLEVQIRTHEMHQANELGVAAHWRYKEGGHRADSGYGRHIAWLRQVLDWRLGSADSEELAQEFRAELLQDSVYVITPQGQVIALPSGSTPVDFAYYVHSGLGHRCRGAKVNGQIVPLTHRLANGDRVEIIATAEGGPSMDWLNPARGFLASGRARAKVRQWFNNQNLEQSIAQGRQMLEREAHRVGVAMPPLDSLATALGHAKPDDLLAALGRGEIGQRTLQTALRGRSAEPPAEPAALPPSFVGENANAARPGGILVVGIDRLLTQLARCCRPLPPDAIVGFVTKGKGVSIHRQDCPNVKQLPAERRLEAQWGATPRDARFQTDVEVTGSAEGLLRTVVDVLGKERVTVRAARTSGRGASERVRLTVEVSDELQLQRVVSLLREVPGVTAVRRC